MSLAAQQGVWARARAERLDLLVLLALADYADEDGRNAGPAIEALAIRVRLPVEELITALHRLEEAGELVAGGTAERPCYHLRCCSDRLYYAR